MLSDIQKLREETGAGVMECKRALNDAAGDFTKAVELIKERGFAKADTKASRATGAGVLEAYIHNGRVGVLLDLRSETDFAAKSDPFRSLAKELTLQIAAMGPDDIGTLLKQPYIKDEKMTVASLVKDTIAKVGENIQVERFCRYEL